MTSFLKHIYVVKNLIYFVNLLRFMYESLKKNKFLKKKLFIYKQKSEVYDLRIYHPWLVFFKKEIKMHSLYLNLNFK